MIYLSDVAVPGGFYTQNELMLEDLAAKFGSKELSPIMQGEHSPEKGHQDLIPKEVISISPEKEKQKKSKKRSSEEKLEESREKPKGDANTAPLEKEKETNPNSLTTQPFVIQPYLLLSQ